MPLDEKAIRQREALKSLFELDITREAIRELEGEYLRRIRDVAQNKVEGRDPVSDMLGISHEYAAFCRLMDSLSSKIADVTILNYRREASR